MNEETKVEQTLTMAIKRPPVRAEWLSLRKNYIGGSEIAALLGLSPYKTPASIWLEKTGRKPVEDEPTEAQLIGLALEDYAARRYMEETGRVVRNFNYMLTRNHALADVDRLVVPDGEKIAAHHDEIRTDRLLECKTSGFFWGDEVPEYYLAQVQLYLGLTGCRYADFAVVFLSPRRDFKMYEVERDDAVIERLFDSIEDFWHDYMDTDTPPPPSDYKEVVSIFPRHYDGKIAESTDEVRSWLLDLKQTEDEAKRLKDHADLVKGQIAAFMQDAETLTDPTGSKIATFKAAKPTEKTDWKAVCDELAINLDPEIVAKAIDGNTASVPGSRRFLISKTFGQNVI